MKRSRWLTVIAILFAFVLVAAACGSDDDDSDSTSAEDEASEDEAAEDEAAEEEEAPAEEEAAEEEEPEEEEEAPAEEEEELSFDFCKGGEGEFSGETVNVLTPETASEAEGFMISLKEFCDETGVEINLNSTRDATTELNLALAAGDPPDVTVIPQPGRGIAFCSDGDAIELAQETLDLLFDEYDENWWDLGSSLDLSRRCGVPGKGDVKSLIWYNVEVFETNGYEVPTTWPELQALVDQILADGVVAPWCVAMESGDATGWHYTDWMEDVVLRVNGTEVYDQWWKHEIPFNGPEITEAAEFIDAIWFQEGAVFGGTDQISTTLFRDAAVPLVNGDCAMVKQASFFGAPIVENGGVIGETHDAFYMPVISEDTGNVLLTAGWHAMGFTDRDVTQAVLAWLGTADAQEARIVGQGGGYLSPNKTHDTSLYESDLEQFFVGFLVSDEYVPRFDAADLMPGEIGSGAFWREPTDYVSGAITLEEMLDNIEDEWNNL